VAYAAKMASLGPVEKILSNSLVAKDHEVKVSRSNEADYQLGHEWNS
jgi:hypothetical protein